MPRIYHSGLRNPNYRTGLAATGVRSSLYNSWQNMKARCTNPKHPKYHRYGGRGITVCPEWNDIRGFAAWAYSAGWAAGLQIDRVDNDGNYDPSNCHWVSASVNASKKSTTVLNMDQVKDIRMLIELGQRDKDIAAVFGVNHGTVWFIRHNITHKSA